LHKCDAGELDPLADLMLGANGAADAVPEVHRQRFC
jgi:hypothetical protein